MALSQSLQQKQLQKLSPQQIQLMKLLQIPTANLEERIKDEIEENPALDVNEESDEERPLNERDEYEASSEDYNDDYDDTPMDGSDDQYESIDVSEYVHEGDDEIADYRTRDDNYGDAEEKQSIPFKSESSFHESLINQLGMLSLNEADNIIAEQIRIWMHPIGCRIYNNIFSFTIYSEN